MDFLRKLETTVAGWLRNVPHLPPNARKWLGDNIWWIVAIGAVLTALGVLGLIGTIMTTLSVLSSPVASYYASTTFVGWAIVTSLVSLVFMVIEGVLLALAISPLKEKQKKGWVLLFATWCVGVISVVVSAILTLNPFAIIGSLIFGAVWAAFAAYFIFEIHGEFAHVERSKGVKAKKTA